MSLKGFHILFITVSTLLALGIGVWCLRSNATHGAPVYSIGAIGAFVAAAALICYGIYFYRKMKRLRIII